MRKTDVLYRVAELVNAKRLQVTDFSRFCAHLYLVHVSRFDPPEDPTLYSLVTILLPPSSAHGFRSQGLREGDNQVTKWLWRSNQGRTHFIVATTPGGARSRGHWPDLHYPLAIA